jgi:hypothetical protein
MDGHIPTRGYIITQSSAPDDGHMVARNMMRNYKKRNKEYKSDICVDFKEVRQSFVDWTDVAEDRGKRRAVVKTRNDPSFCIE